MIQQHGEMIQSQDVMIEILKDKNKELQESNTQKDKEILMLDEYAEKDDEVIKCLQATVAKLKMKLRAKRCEEEFLNIQNNEKVQQRARTPISLIDDMSLCIVERRDVIEEQLKAIDEFENFNMKVQLKEVPEVGEEFEFFEDIFDDTCSTPFTCPHIEITSVVEDLSVEESEGTSEDSYSSSDETQLEISTLDEDLLALSQTILERMRRLVTEMALFDFRDWLARRQWEFSFGHIEEREGVDNVSTLLYVILMLSFYQGGRAIPMHGRKPIEP